MKIHCWILFEITSRVSALTYKAAVVEMAPDENSSYTLRKELTIDSTIALANEAAQGGAQIIVFPEYGLIGWPNTPYDTTQKAAYAELFEEIPEPTGDIPCLNPSLYSNAPTIVALSCGAMNNNISIVGCMGDIVSCPNSDYPGCRESSDGHLQFNTAVAFDTDGTFLVKYHKTNFWGEDNYLDPPQGCQQVSFDTSFGVTFGLAICADIFYEFPNKPLIDNGIQNFVSPIAWSNYMAHMQAMPWHQGWSLRNCVNIMFANYPWNYGQNSISTGSGIFSCGEVKASYYKTPTWNPQKMGTIIYADLDSDVSLQAPSTLEPSSLLTWDATGNPGWQFAPLAEGYVCSDTICCYASNFVGKTYGYSIGALGGIDSGCGNYEYGYDCGIASYHWPAEVCGIFSCMDQTGTCLDYQTPTGNLTGVRLETRVSTNSTVLPHVLAYGTSGTTSEQILIEPGTGLNFFQNGKVVVLTIDSFPHPISSAEIYGRLYEKDNLLYTCPVSSETEKNESDFSTDQSNVDTVDGGKEEENGFPTDQSNADSSNEENEEEGISNEENVEDNDFSMDQTNKGISNGRGKEEGIVKYISIVAIFRLFFQ
eukprot:CAMPEP_0194425568 /NCGR_PEP_ID=MMETSP0176-20130528/24830_1 /TAXON_ID=216777 /ORGANISM="Proboscia alata, Strain PI-D3" /LENGTH=593 /DNA_ID=CAMNT_0039235935 /DNA_START=82 /DNA_END=1863 /DNA_ORIENTATION=-